MSAKSLIVAVSALIAAASVLSAKSLPRQDPPAGQQPPPEMQAMMPGPAHARLMKLAGQYTTSSTFVAEPGAEPMVSEGTATLRTALDGRFLVEENAGSLMGMETKGLRLYGFNNLSGKYESTWTYSMDTAMLHLTGTSDDDGRTIRMTGEYQADDGTTQVLYVVTRHVSDDSFVISIYGSDPDAGPAGPTLETTYTRRK